MLNSSIRPLLKSTEISNKEKFIIGSHDLVQICIDLYTKSLDNIDTLKQGNEEILDIWDELKIEKEELRSLSNTKGNEPIKTALQEQISALETSLRVETHSEPEGDGGCERDA